MSTGTGNRRYPALYEKLVPAAIGLLAVIILAMIVLTVLVALGLAG
ncbi:MAG: hypothetical protein HYZ26_04145 [Chloroflexi bacterium]|nr:hypothetical protein [Chloroflexota bacterium]